MDNRATNFYGGESMITTIILLGLPILLPTFIVGLIFPDSANDVLIAMGDLFAPLYMLLESIIVLFA